MSYLISDRLHWVRVRADPLISKIPGAPIMSVARGKYVIERLPDAPEK